MFDRARTLAGVEGFYLSFAEGIAVDAHIVDKAVPFASCRPRIFADQNGKVVCVDEPRSFLEIIQYTIHVQVKPYPVIHPGNVMPFPVIHVHTSPNITPFGAFDIDTGARKLNDVGARSPLQPPGVVPLGDDGLRPFVERVDLYPGRDRDRVSDAEGLFITAIHIVAVTIEQKCATYPARLPLRIAHERPVIVNAGGEVEFQAVSRDAWIRVLGIGIDNWPKIDSGPPLIVCRLPRRQPDVPTAQPARPIGLEVEL